jgi:predicted kinase
MKHIKKFNEGLDDETRDLLRQTTDEESADIHEVDYNTIDETIKNTIYDLSGELEDATNNISAQLIFKDDKLITEYGTYEYELKIKRIA